MNRWENSEVWTRNFAPFLQIGLLRVGRIRLTAAQMLTIGTSPLQYMPAVPGYVYYNQASMFFKEAGPAFTTAGQTVQSQYMNSAFSAHANWVTTGVLDQTAETPYSLMSVANQGGLNTICSEDATHVGGKGLRLSTSTGVNFGGTGSPCTLVFLYILLPVNLSILGGPITTLPLP